MSWRAPAAIDQRIDELTAAARHSVRAGDLDAAWEKLGDAHVLSQPWVRPHVQVHAAMLGVGLRTRDGGEVAGQLFRLLVAAPGSSTGRYPAGNSGRSNVSAFAPAPVREDLADFLAGANGEPAQEVLAPSQVRSLYNRLAPFYDVVSRPYGWFWSKRLAEQAISELRLRPGDTVVDLGTGTGRNLPELAGCVGPAGRVVGVDLSPGMLERARRRVTDLGLDTVELVEADIAEFDLPSGADAVVSSYAMEMLPDYDEVIARLVEQLRRGGRIVVNGLRDPDRWPEWIVRLGSALSRPFGVSEAHRSHRPWEAIETHTIDVVYDEAMAGAVYLAAGSAPGRETRADLG